MAPREEVEDVRDYYARILPFYETESVARAHLAFWREIVRSRRPGRILEIGAGLGRITVALALRAPAVGIDVSLPMLAAASGSARARVRLRGSRAATGARSARFVAADMRRVNFGPVFDLIVAPGDPFSHLIAMSERREALRAVASQLAPAGRFVLEGLWRRRGETASPRRRVRHEKGVLTIEEAWFPIGTGDQWHARYRYFDRRPGEADRTLSASFVARSWDPSRIRRLFASCGLSIENIWGDFDRRPFRRGCRRLVVVARRKSGIGRAHRRGATERRRVGVDIGDPLRSSIAVPSEKE